MKKFFSLFAAVLFAASMMATEVVFTNADFAGQGTANTGSEVSATKDGVTFTCNKGYSADESLRCYAHAAISITASSTISKINFTTTGGKNGGLDAEVAVNATSYEVADLASQARFTEIKVTIDDGEGGEGGDPEPPVVSGVVTFTNADFAGQGTANTGSEVTATKDGVTFTCNKGYSADESLRCYAHAAISITASSVIAKINFTTTGGKDGGLDAEVAVNATSYEVADLASQARFTEIKVTLAGGDVPPSVNYYVAGSMNNWGPADAYMLTPSNNGEYKGEFTFSANDELKVIGFDGETTTWFPGGVDNNFKITEAGDYKITFNPAGNVDGWYAGFFNVVMKQGPVAPTNCAEAREAALSVSANNELYNDGAEYTIEGYVTAIQTAFNPTNKNISFWMADTENGGNVIQAYRAACQTAEDAPAVGDKVAVTGKLTKYNATPEFAAGCTFVIKEKSAPAVNLGPKTIGEFLALKNAKDTCVISGVVTSIQNTTYGNLYLADENDTVYIYGVLTAEGVSKQFESLNVKVNDTLTVKALYGEYNNAPQVKDAIFVEVKKAPAQDINVNMSKGLIYYDYVADGGWWQIYGQDEHFAVSISNISTTQAEGTYTIADLDADYTYLSIFNATDTTEIFFVDGSVTLSIDGNGNVTVAGTLVGNDGNNYIFNLQFIVPTPQETVDVNIQNAELIDYYADYGLYGVYGTDANDIYVQIAIWTETFEGNFSEEDLDLQYIGSGIFEGEEQVNIYTAAITVTPGNGGDYNITATIVGYNNKQYNVTMYVPAGETAIENVDAAVKAIKRLVNGNLIIEKGNKTYNANGARIR